MDKLIIASKNKGKINEIKNILKDLPIEVISMTDAGFDMEMEEKGSTFSENAMMKARSLYEHTDGMVLADDSGLEVNFLNDAPGIFTARFAGDSSGQEEKNKKILHLLKGIDKPYRTARFVCSMAFVSKEKSFTVNGSVEGIISDKPQGTEGFGYDPIFYLPEYNKTMAELPEKTKNKISHRAIALEKLRNELNMLSYTGVVFKNDKNTGNE